LAAQVKQAIDDWSDPPNAPMTQIIKGDKKHLPVGTMVNDPLVDTGHLKQSMTYAVKVTK
jgi:hypothetical protein